MQRIIENQSAREQIQERKIVTTFLKNSGVSEEDSLLIVHVLQIGKGYLREKINMTVTTRTNVRAWVTPCGGLAVNIAKMQNEDKALRLDINGLNDR